MINKTKINLESGQAMMVATVFFLIISITIIFGLIGPIIRQQKTASSLMTSRQSYFLAEAGIEDVVYRLSTAKTVSAHEVLSLNGNSVTTVTLDTLGGKEIVSTGDVQNFIRKLESELLLGTGVAFHYGIQSGGGGFVLSNNAGVYGNVYANSSVIGANGAFVTGSVVATGTINRVIVGTGVTGDAHAPDVVNSTVRGSLYCQTGSGNNKPCNTTRPDPVGQPFPITSEQIDEWKAIAATGGTIAGQSYSGTNHSLGPVKINGNLNITNGSQLTMTGTIWVTGNLVLSNNAVIKLAAGYGTFDGILVVEGTSTFSNGATFSGSGTAGSYVMLLSTNTTASAVSLSNNAGAVITYAPYGTVHLSNNAGVTQITAKTIFLDNNATITYESGLIDSSFTSGPGGGYEILKWREVE